MFDSVALVHPAVSLSSAVWMYPHSFYAAALIKCGLVRSVFVMGQSARLNVLHLILLN